MTSEIMPINEIEHKMQAKKIKHRTNQGSSPNCNSQERKISLSYGINLNKNGKKY